MKRANKWTNNKKQRRKNQLRLPSLKEKNRACRQLKNQFLPPIKRLFRQNKEKMLFLPLRKSSKVVR
jgi:hypothetical protein